MGVSPYGSVEAEAVRVRRCESTYAVIAAAGSRPSSFRRCSLVPVNPGASGIQSLRQVGPNAWDLAEAGPIQGIEVLRE